MRVGSAMCVFRLIRTTGTGGCEHHVLIRAGRPSYPNADQGAENAADSFPTFLMDAMAAWWKRWVLPAQCRWAGHQPGAHELVVVADPVEVLWSEGPDLHDDVGMRPLDIWVAARQELPGAVVVTAPTASAARAALDEAQSDEGPLGPPTRLRVLLLTERSGEGNLRDL
jgi:hypothetical protein